MDKILLLPTSLSIKADVEHYKKTLASPPEDAHRAFGIHAFDFSNFTKYKNKKYQEFFEKIKLTEDEEFLKEVWRILNEGTLEDHDLISYIVETAPIDILPAYYRLFSQVSLLLDSHLHPNLTSSKKSILNGLSRGGCFITNSLNEIELCCFVVRYCDTKENIETFKSILCKDAVERVDSLFSKKKSKVTMCSCNVSKIREIQGQDL